MHRALLFLSLILARESNQVNPLNEIQDLVPPLTLDKIKSSLKETGIFNLTEKDLSANERSELDQLFNTVEIMMTSRNRQPSNVESTHTSLLSIRDIIDKQVREGHISISLANKFKWNQLSLRPKSDRPPFELDKRNNMRIFYIDE